MGEPSLGLRELKKQRTRATIVDVASGLCARQGYENTTVEQIAAAAEVSPRTFSRYFPSKEAVIGALIEETAEHIAAALAAQPTDITEHDALVRAHVEAKRLGMKLIIGCRLDLRDGPSMLCLPTDRAAYGRLSRLLSLGKSRAKKGDCHIDRVT